MLIWLSFWVVTVEIGIPRLSGSEYELFERHVRPVLANRCLQCHGRERGAGDSGRLVRLDTREGLRSTVSPGDPGKSRLLTGVSTDTASGKRSVPDTCRLSETEAPGIAEWVREGALDPRGERDGKVSHRSSTGSQHWAFRPPVVVKPPSVRDTSWPHNPIDHFILSALEAASLKPAPPADRRTLLRRITLDLVGLPPSEADYDSFIHDESAEAYPKAIDRLLSSPGYGERWGRHWLDVARYSDTKGYVFYYEESQFVQPHRYRDWVIGALNRDLPYNRFLELQLAADQILGVSRNPSTQRAATTIDPEDAGNDFDLAAMGFVTLGRRFLGNPQDIIDDELDAIVRTTQALTIGCARCHDHKFDPITTADYYALYGIFQSSQEHIARLGSRPMPSTVTTYGEAERSIEFDRELRRRVQKLETAYQAACDQVTERLRRRVPDYLRAVIRTDALPVVSANVRPSPDDINPYNVRQWDRYLQGRRLRHDPVFAPLFQFMDLPPNKWVEGSKELVDRFLTNQDREHPLNAKVAQMFTKSPASLEEVAQRYGSLLKGIHEEWMATLESAKAKKQPPPAHFSDPDSEQLRLVLYGDDSPVLPPVGTIIELDTHLYFDDPNRVALAKLQMETEQWAHAGTAAPAYALVLLDRAKPEKGRILKRGDPAHPGVEVPHRFLQVLTTTNSPGFANGSGRLDLARAISSPRNPLTARVMVNRVWAGHFGVGLVPTVSDFGTRAEPPSHPELLDWLACRFVEDGWSLKKLHRLILLSATYQQAATAVSTLQSINRSDPENRLLSHFPRRRLDFEAFRDSILSATGELNTVLAGESFDLNSTSPVSRRTVYARVDRKAVPDALRAFDFANPDAHAPQRHTTLVPQQALYLLNSDWIVDRSKAAAIRAIKEVDGTREDPIDRLYAIIHRRRPTGRESEITRAVLKSVDDSSEDRMQQLQQLAQVLFCSNEFAFVE